MPRLLLSDELWSKLREILLHKAIYNKRDLRMTVEITGGQINDCTQAPALIAKVPTAETIIADKGVS
jgi:hypothetical protein